MFKLIAIILILFNSLITSGQTILATETVSNYSIAQKRLLVFSTIQFINFITQDNLDQDSVTTIACHITGMPFLLPYNVGFAGQISGAENLINEGRTAEAIKLLSKLQYEKKIQLLVELGNYYLHKPGTRKKDLDSAGIYIETASELSKKGKYENWRTECNFLFGELSNQKGNRVDGENRFVEIISSGEGDKSFETMARGYYLLGTCLPDSNSMKLSYYEKSLGLYEKLNSKEQQIELLYRIASLHEHIDFNLMEKDFLRILSLMRSTGFKHVLFAQNMVAYSIARQTRYIDALEYALKAFENMKWSGMPVSGTFLTRVGVAYWLLGKNEEALAWFKKAVASSTNETHLFWYKSLFQLHTLLIEMNRPGESLSTINETIGKSPPVTLWEKMQVLSVKGECYEKLNKPSLADKYYAALIKLANENPRVDPSGELSGTYMQIARFYIAQKDLSKAQVFLKKGLSDMLVDRYNISQKYLLLYKMDSLAGNYKSALKNHIKYKLYYDSAAAMDQRKKMDELTIKYAAEKKDQDIKLLTQQAIVQQTELKQNRLTRNIMIAGTGLLLIIVGLLFSQFKLKQRTNAAMSNKNMALQHLVEEKEWLLKEVHHRVKNNLHTVISLLESQAAYLENDALKAIENSQHRIYAMSLIHQKLYQTEDVKTIDMSVYLPEFIRYLDESFDTHYRIQFKLEIDAINLGVSQAISIALIINEAVTNSIKYAFPLEKKGIIEITVKKVTDEITLIIADNGIGIDEALAKASSESLGLKLIKGLSEDINASINIKNDNGTKIIITFNADPFHNGDDILNVIKGKEIYA